jgi:hypothetical protein
MKDFASQLPDFDNFRDRFKEWATALLPGIVTTGDSRLDY